MSTLGVVRALLERNCVLVCTFPDAVQCTFEGLGLSCFSGKGRANAFTCTLRNALGALQCCCASDLRCVVLAAAPSSETALEGEAMVEHTAHFQPLGSVLDARWQLTYAVRTSRSVLCVRVYAYDVLLLDARPTGLFDVAGAQMRNARGVYGVRGIAVNPSCTRLVATHRCNQRLPCVYDLIDASSEKIAISSIKTRVIHMPSEYCTHAGIRLCIGRVWSLPCFTSDTTLLMSSNAVGHADRTATDSLEASLSDDVVYHVDLDGRVLCSTCAVKKPTAIASRDATVAIGNASGLYMFSLNDGVLELKQCFKIGEVRALCFADAEYFCASVSVHGDFTHSTLALYSRETGVLARRIHVTERVVHSIAMRADGMLIVTDDYGGRMQAFSTDGVEAPCAQTYNAKMVVDAIALHAQRLFVIATCTTARDIAILE